jgi:glycosyltransferase involved in cell wall biosynthesis
LPASIGAHELEPGSSHPVNRVAVIIPALDEEEALPTLLSALPPGLGPVVVVDNGSSDRTVEVARRGGATVVHEPRRGYGAACLAGLAHLESLDPPPLVVVFVDADQGDPGALVHLVGPILDGGADMVLGVRGGDRGAVPFHARWGNALVLALTRLLHGVRYRDFPPFRAVGFQALRRLEMDDMTWGWTLQMQLRARHRNLRTVEVPLPHTPRRAGRSKISGSLTGSVRAGSRMLRTVLRERSVAARSRSSRGHSPRQPPPGS